jgi:hypothetical protein
MAMNVSNDLAVIVAWRGGPLIVDSLVINNMAIVNSERVDAGHPLPGQVGIPVTVATASRPDAHSVMYRVGLPVGSVVNVDCTLRVDPGVTVTEIVVRAENQTTHTTGGVGSATVLNPGGTVQLSRAPVIFTASTQQ